MKLYDFFQMLGIDREKVLGRFMGNVGLYLRFVNKFKDDENFEGLKKAIAEKDYQKVEMTAHTLKGVAANFGFDKLSLACAAEVNAVRAGDHDSLENLLVDVESEYEKIVSCIGEGVEE